MNGDIVLLKAALFCIPLLFLLSTAPANAAKNLASLAKASASSIWQDSPDYAPAKAIDGDMKTRWGGKGRDSWYQLEWDAPRAICGMVMHNYDEVWNKNIPFTLQVWDRSLDGGTGGFRDVQTVTPASSTAAFQFPVVTTTKLRVNNVITFWEIEVYDDPEVVAAMAEAAGKMEIAVAGDLQGHLIGSVSRNTGEAPVVGAKVVVSGRNPAGAWSCSVTTGEHGLWQVDMPEGCTGPIVATATNGDHKSEVRVEAGDITHRLTPRPNQDWRRLSLDGKWDFVVDPPTDYPAGAVKQWSSIETPSHWEMEGFLAETGRAAYRKRMLIPATWVGKRIKLRSEGIYSQARIWVNGRKVGGHIGDTLFELDITDAIEVGHQNEIAILVDERSFANDIDKLSFYAHCNLAGIWRPIEVFCVEPAHISRVALSTAFDEHYRDADLLVDVDVSNEQSRGLADAEIRLTVVDPAGKKLSLPGLSAKVTLGAWEWRRVSLKAKAANPEQWNAESPKLYRLKAELVVPEQAAAPIEQRFGFKQVEIKGRTYTINGRPVKFWGANRLDSHPLMGRAVTQDVVKQDLALMKGCNINAIRTSHFPAHPAVMDMADKMGFYVEDEASFIWVDSGMFGPEKSYGNDLRFAPFFISVTSALVERDRNHPCVSIWSVCNESAFGRNLAINWDWIRKSDPTRPCSAGQSANLEIATYHNPTSM